MKSQYLAIPAVFLLIAVAMLPGLSFSLTSSVTSNFNTISEIDESGFGLYHDAGCESSWSGSAFDNSFITVNRNSDGTITMSDQTIRMNGFEKVYLKKDSNCAQLTITFSYSAGEADHLIRGVRVLLTSVNTDQIVDSNVVTWSEAKYGITLDVSTLSISTVDIELSYDAGTYDSQYDKSHKLDIHFSENLGEEKQFTNLNNVVGLTDNVDGLVVISDDHSIVESKKPSGVTIGDKCYSVTNGSGAFAKGQPSTAEIKSDGKTPFIICLDNDGKKNSVFTVTITVNNSDGTKITFSDEISGKSRYYYVGINEIGTGIMVSEDSSVKSFSNSTVDITVTGDPQGQGSNIVRLYLITMRSST